MTEDEAKSKWCPFTRVACQLESRTGPWTTGWNRREGESFGHREKIGGENHCIGSACMAWRWDTGGAYRIEADAEFRRTGRHKSPTEGFCGLANRPDQ